VSELATSLPPRRFERLEMGGGALGAHGGNISTLYSGFSGPRTGGTNRIFHAGTPDGGAVLCERIYVHASPKRGQRLEMWITSCGW